LTSALEGGEGSASRPGRTLTPEKRLGGPQGRYGGVRKISPPPGFDPRTVQPVGSQTSNVQFKKKKKGKIRNYHKPTKYTYWAMCHIILHYILQSTFIA